MIRILDKGKRKEVTIIRTADVANFIESQANERAGEVT